jgi:hypothetical protein
VILVVGEDSGSARQTITIVTTSGDKVLKFRTQISKIGGEGLLRNWYRVI